jgi:hypothetical protein
MPAAKSLAPAGQRENMSTRAISIAVACAVVLVAGSAVAQQGAVAKLSGVEGSVLVSQGDAMVSGVNGQRLPAGTRVVTLAGAKVTVDYDIGCDIRLKENERFTVRLGTDCAALKAEVVAVGPAAGAIGGGSAAGGTAAGLGTTGAIVGIAAAGALGYGAYETFKKQNVSPN